MKAVLEQDRFTRNRDQIFGQAQVEPDSVITESKQKQTIRENAISVLDANENEKNRVSLHLPPAVLGGPRGRASF